MTMKNNNMVWTWCGWEPLQFYRRLGGFHEAQEGNALWADDWRALLDSEECAGKLVEAGINWVTTHFYKGFGLESENEEITATAKMIANYHRHGVKVFTYIQYGTVMPETIQAESEESKNWGRLDWNGQHDGHPYEYGDQYWRAKPCANQPGFRDYMLRCVDKAIEIGADGIWIDNLQADGCYCPCCQNTFQEYLRKNIADPWRQLGVHDLTKVSIPRAERPRDPVYQAWSAFRREETKTSLRMLAQRARQLKPDVLVAVNVGIGNHQRALIENGNWFGNLDCVDYTYAENGFFPNWRDGKIITQSWPMGIAESIGIKIVPGAGNPGGRVPDKSQLRQVFAESAINGGHSFGGPWGLRGEDGGAEPILLRDTEYRKAHRQLVDWYQEHSELFSGSVNAAPVALLYSKEAMIADEKNSRIVFDSMVQLLMQHQIPFRYILSDRLEQLDGVSLLILPRVLPISDEQSTVINRFTANGGRVLAIGRTSLYDENMRQRRDYALTQVFGRSFSQQFESENGNAIIVNPHNGSIFIPGEWGISANCRISGDRIARAIRDVVDMPQVISPLPTVGVTWRLLPDGRYVAGLLNYDETTVNGVMLQGKGTVPEITFYNVDNECVKLTPVVKQNEWRVTLPALQAEGFVVLRRGIANE